MPVRTLIFDMDGLMVDTEPLYWEVAREMAKKYGTAVADATLRRMMGRGRIESMRIFAEECGIAAAVPTELLIEREQGMTARFAAGVEPLPGLHSILDRFRDLRDDRILGVEPLGYPGRHEAADLLQNLVHGTNPLSATCFGGAHGDMKVASAHPASQCQ